MVENIKGPKNRRRLTPSPSVSALQVWVCLIALGYSDGQHRGSWFWPTPVMGLVCGLLPLPNQNSAIIQSGSQTWLCQGHSVKWRLFPHFPLCSHHGYLAFTSLIFQPKHEEIKTLETSKWMVKRMVKMKPAKRNFQYFQRITYRNIEGIRHNKQFLGKDSMLVVESWGTTYYTFQNKEIWRYSLNIQVHRDHICREEVGVSLMIFLPFCLPSFQEDCLFICLWEMVLSGWGMYYLRED